LPKSGHEYFATKVYVITKKYYRSKSWIIYINSSTPIQFYSKGAVHKMIQCV